MSSFNELEDAVYESLIKLHPTRTFIFAYNNTPEVPMPYTVIDIVKMDAVGTASQEGLTTLGIQSTLQPYEAKVCLETIGENTSAQTAGAIAQEIDFSLRTPLMRDALATNKLSLMRYKPIERFSRIRDTKTFMVYKQDLFFAYSLVDAQDVGYISTLDIDAVYHDAGRAGHVIASTIHVAQP
jgi:hypothetical protein